jgi:hypothetical protein
MITMTLIVYSPLIIAGQAARMYTNMDHSVMPAAASNSKNPRW